MPMQKCTQGSRSNCRIKDNRYFAKLAEGIESYEKNVAIFRIVYGIKLVAALAGAIN